MIASELLARPMTIGDLLDRAISIYRRNFLTLIGIAAMISVPLLIVQVVAAVFALPTDFATLSSSAARGSASAITSFFIYLGIVLIASIFFGIASVFEHGAVIAVVSDTFQNASPGGIRQAYGRAWRHRGALFGTLILSGLLYVLIFGALSIPFIALIASVGAIASTSAASAVVGLVTICLCAAFLPAMLLWLFFYTRWIFWPQAVMIESQGVRSSLGRSWRLARGSFWRIFLVVFLTSLFIYLLTITPTTVITFAAFLFPSPIISTVLNSTVGILISIFVAPLNFTILTLLYYDLRIRKEGLDLELRAQQLAQAPTLS